MPLVRIDAMHCDTERLKALGRAAHEALGETMGFPDEDRFQILTGHDGQHGLLRHGAYLGVPRDDGIVYVAITLRAGRPDAQKQALYQRISELAEAYAGVEPRNMFIVLTENSHADWSLGYGAAQYLQSEGEGN
ncbi:tautomerase family protein [Streptomyces sp. NPDC097595]|uniref:tautomerase family protein n=1 Tax=Streptomyces sp. NPDC097595 TaxID=3366090 RepID=UPI0037F99CFD